MKMYENDGYSQRRGTEHPRKITSYGLGHRRTGGTARLFCRDDEARQYDWRIFTRGIQPHVRGITESNDIDTLHAGPFMKERPEVAKLRWKYHERLARRKGVRPLS